MPKRPQRRATPVVPDDHVSETDEVDIEVDENTPFNDENAFSQPTHASPLLALRTPLSHSRASQDTALRDITDQFFHPPSPSPVRIAKLKNVTPHTIEPPRRPKKPKSLAYPADPPNWLYSRSSSSLPPSSPFPPSTTNFDHARLTDRSVVNGHSTAARYEYHLGTPSQASDSDPFGFVAVERVLKARRGVPALAPRKSPSRISSAKSPPRSTVLPSAPAPVFASFSQLDGPVPTNNEDIDGLYEDEPVAGPSHVHLPVAPLLTMNSDRPFVEIDATHSQPTFPDPLRTPRKRKRRASPTPNGDPDLDEEGSDIPSSPSPVKVSVGVGSHRGDVRPSDIPVLKLTRARERAMGTAKPPITPSRKTRATAPYQNILTPSSTHRALSPRQSIAPSTPVQPRRSTRQAAVGARAKLKGMTSDGENDSRVGRMTLRSRSAKANGETRTTTSRSRDRHSPSKAKTSTRTQKVTVSTTTRSTRGRPRKKPGAKDTKGKGKAGPRENVLDLSEDTLERYDKERRERLEYFKRLEGYQIQKENVYVV